MPEPTPRTDTGSAGGSGGGIDAATVARVATLARLGLDDAELARSVQQLGTILEHFRALQAVDTAGVAPLEHAPGGFGVPAADVVAAFPQPRTTLLPLTPHAREGFFVVPAVLDTDFGAETRGASPAADDVPPDDDPGADG